MYLTARACCNYDQQTGTRKREIRNENRGMEGIVCLIKLVGQNERKDKNERRRRKDCVFSVRVANESGWGVSPAVTSAVLIASKGKCEQSKNRKPETA